MDSVHIQALATIFCGIVAMIALMIDFYFYNKNHHNKGGQ